MNVHALSPIRQKLLAIGLAMSAAACMIVVVGMPLVGLVQTQKREIEKAEAELANWQGIAASRDTMESAAAALAADEKIHEAVFQASSEAQATSGLQSLVRKALLDAGADVKSLQPLEARAGNGFHEVGVRVTAMANHEQFEDAISKLSAAKPSLVISGAQVQLSSISRRPVGQAVAPTLQIRLDVGAYANVQGGRS
jgi:general secretion pathway protein M